MHDNKIMPAFALSLLPASAKIRVGVLSQSTTFGIVVTRDNVVTHDNARRISGPNPKGARAKGSS